MCRKIVAVWVSLLLVFGSLVIFVNIPMVSGADLVIGDDESVYTVSGYETWEDVAVLAAGKLVVPSGATLNATNIFLQDSSIVEILGGNVTLYNPSNSKDVKFNGTCSYFNVTDFSNVIMRGSDGYADTSSPGPYNAYISVSKGGDAELNIIVTGGIRIENSTLNLTGGDGFDLPSSTADDCNTWTNGASLNGYVAAGGESLLYFNLTSSTHSLEIINSTILCKGGNGGDAANGGNGTNQNGGEGGGYSGGVGGTYEVDGGNGGAVGGHVGAGGQVVISLESQINLNIKDSDILAISGNGGDGGDGGGSGGTGWQGSGGGGGGYGGGGGGSSYSNGSDGGVVSGYVGSGGDSIILILSNEVEIFDSYLMSMAGKGGDAGNGGDNNESGSCGGGGYGGGAGSGYLGNGGDGIVQDHVGTGGNANISINGKNSEIGNLVLYSHGGDGGAAGNGGIGIENTAGGGGYGGGGGGQNNNMLVGDGIAKGYVGSGGSAHLFSTFDISKITNSNFTIKAGNGGMAGNGGNRSGTGSGAGGGGYGGGGGGTNAYGGDGVVSDYVGGGGSAYSMVSADVLIFIYSNISVIGGDGGDGGIGGKYSAPGGGGAGGGGYAGAGGGGGGAYRGGLGFVTGRVGDGGNTSLIFQGGTPSVSASSFIASSRGLGGFAPTSPGGDDGDGSGGAGTGRITENGTVVEIIPMSVPLPLSPSNGTTIKQIPTFTWLHLHDSTTNGDLVDYTIQIDDDINFSSLVDFHTTSTANYTPLSQLPDGTYYWRVKANYSNPLGSSAGWSEIWVITISTLAPVDLNIRVDHIGGEIVLNWTSPPSPVLDHYLIYRSNDLHDFNFSAPYNNSLSWPDSLGTNWTDPGIGEGSNDTNFFYIVRGVNNTGFEEQNMNIVGKYVSWLNKGWNLVSVPLKQSNTSVKRVLITIAGSYNIIVGYNSEDGKWHNSNNDLTDIDHKMGFWIHMKTSGRLVTNGSAVNSVIHLTGGWNLMGYPSFYETSVGSEFSDVPSFGAVQCYNNSDTSDHWKHNKTGKSFGNDLILMKPGLGYWVFVSSDSDWIVDY